MIPRRKKKKKKPPAWRPAPLTETQIKEWVKDWYSRRKTYPSLKSGRIPGALGETWNAVEGALRTGGLACRRRRAAPG